MKYKIEQILAKHSQQDQDYHGDYSDAYIEAEKIPAIAEEILGLHFSDVSCMFCKWFGTCKHQKTICIDKEYCEHQFKITT
jgi:hypothetical protein